MDAQAQRLMVEGYKVHPQRNRPHKAVAHSIGAFCGTKQKSALSALLTPKRCNTGQLLRMTIFDQFARFGTIIPDSVRILDYPRIDRFCPKVLKTSILLI